MNLSVTPIIIQLITCLAASLSRNEESKVRFSLTGSALAALCATTIAIGGSFIESEAPLSLLHPTLIQALTDFESIPLSLILLAYITVMSVIVSFFSERYLLGESYRAKFLNCLGMLSAISCTIALADSLALISAMLFALSLSLFKIIGLRQDAGTAAQTVLKYQVWGDLLFFLSALLLESQFGLSRSMCLSTLSKESFQPYLIQAHLPDWSLSLTLLPMVLALAIKSALYPFHKWLLATLDAPTPLSGFLHAGVVNVAAIVTIKCFPFLQCAPGALLAFALISLLSVMFGTITMSAQTDVKRKLVFSTVGQMGFMCLQCAVGALGPAIFHLITHGLFKAHMFLQCGQVIAEAGLLKSYGLSNSKGKARRVFFVIPALLLALTFLWFVDFDPNISVSASTASFLLASLFFSITTLPGKNLSTRLISAAVALLFGAILISSRLEEHIASLAPAAKDASFNLAIAIGALATMAALLAKVKHTALGRRLYVYVLGSANVTPDPFASLESLSSNNERIM